MAEAPGVAFFQQRIVPFAEARVPLEDRGLQFAESLYEVVAVGAGRARELSAHAGRMRRSAELLGLADGVPSDDEWRRVFEQLQEHERLKEGLLYAQLTGGTAARSHVPLERPQPSFFAYLAAFRFPRLEDTERGIAAITLDDTRWSRCDLKTTMLLPSVLAKREALAAGAREALFIGPGGEVREGAASNVFLVEGRRLVTPEPSQHVLPGLTRPLVQRLATELQVVAEPVSSERLRKASEVFVTSTTFTVMPVVRLDGEPVGSGRAGEVSLELGRRLRAEWGLDG